MRSVRILLLVSLVGFGLGCRSLKDRIPRLSALDTEAGKQLSATESAAADSTLTRLRNYFSLNPTRISSKDKTAIVRDPDGTWRVDPRVASEQEKVTSGFSDAETLFREEKYDKAASAFKRIAKRHKDTPLAEEALFMQGESLFKANRLPGADDAYATLLTKYPTTRFMPQAIQRKYDIAYYWLEDAQERAQGKPSKVGFTTRYVNFFDKTRPLFDTEGRAIETIEQIQNYDPLGPLTDDALMMAGAQKFTGGSYIQAANYYEQLVEAQPKSEHAPRAFVVGAQSHLRAYEGPSYDVTDLNKAERMTKSALARAHTLTTEQRTRLEQDLRLIYLERAKRLFVAGDQYKRMKQPRAARYYYELVLKRYPDTDWARTAEERIQEVDAYIAKLKPTLLDKFLVDHSWFFGEPIEYSPYYANSPEADRTKIPRLSPSVPKPPTWNPYYWYRDPARIPFRRSSWSSGIAPRDPNATSKINAEVPVSDDAANQGGEPKLGQPQAVQ